MTVHGIVLKSSRLPFASASNLTNADRERSDANMIQRAGKHVMLVEFGR